MSIKIARRDFENTTERRRRRARERYAAKKLLTFERSRAAERVAVAREQASSAQTSA